MSVREQLFCIWLLPIFAALGVTAFWGMSGLIAPIPTSLSAHEVVAIYKTNSLSIVSGLALMQVICALPVPFSCVVAHQMRRMKGMSDVLSYSYLSYCICAASLGCLAIMFIAAAAFRPEGAPEVTQLMNDLGWYCLLAITTGLFAAQNVFLAAAIYLDRSRPRIFPLWVAHFNIVVAIAHLPGLLALTNKEGAFAIDGAFTFWGRMAICAIYFTIMFVVVRNAILSSRASFPSAPVLEET